jgi:hydrogenase/urease accessory protein HupE
MAGRLPHAAAVFARLFLFLAVGLFSGRALGHPIDSATLVIVESGEGRFDVRFQSGSGALSAIKTPATYPASCSLDGGTLSCGESGLSGTIEFPWLRGSQTQLFVNIIWRDDSELNQVIDPDVARLTVYDRGAKGWAALRPVLFDYGRLGVEHILLGFDHLCLVIALAFLVRERRRLVATITAFTVAHSITLGLTTLGFLDVPVAPVEAMIALSIVLITAECLRPAETLTRRAPWVLAFTFGLLHGFGFASALREVGLPEGRIPSALLGFNLGVELGQLAVVSLFVLTAAALRRFRLERTWFKPGFVYAMGSWAAFWSIERVLTVFGVG